MRRSTRVLVLKAKDGEFVRVLRSGRRLWVESADFKHRGDENAGDWSPLSDAKTKLKPTVSAPPCGQSVSPAVGSMEIDDGKSFKIPPKTTPRFDSGGNSMFANVYNRKRKRSVGKLPLDSSHCSNDKGERKFGLQFVRRKSRKVIAFDRETAVEQEEHDHGLMISIVVHPSCTSHGVFPRFLSSVLQYMSRETIGVVEMSMLLLSSPISPVFASIGIHFTLGQVLMQRTGICRIFGARQFAPLFTVDFAALPFCFLHLHATMLFRSVRISCLCWIDFDRENADTDIDESLSYINDQSDYYSLRRSSIPDKDSSKGTKAVRTTSRVGRQGSRNVLYRTGMITRSKSKRRCRSLRSRKARIPLLLVLQKATESNQVLRNSARQSLKSSSLVMNVDVGSQSCLANLLVVETDHGYRIEGAEIVLDVSDSNEWILAVKKDGLTRYSIKALRELRCNHITNRFTHAVIFVAESGWKLEFPDRNNWLDFKELYKVCWEKNAILPASPIVKIIPVPGVFEVINSWDSTAVPFKMPESYIKTSSDELSKALSSKTANYDIDSEDEDWLDEFNSGLGTAELVSEEMFELLIDVFEKASYCMPEDCNYEQDAASLCYDHATSSLVAAEVYRYWMKKRNQKRAPLIRVFQLNEARRAELITKPVLRKKRSLKRSANQPIQCGRGKDSTALQAIAAAEEKAVEEQYSDISLEEEAKASASRSMEVAIGKRQRAQFLMENADLAVYQATIALRIADTAQNIESEQLPAHFLE